MFYTTLFRKTPMITKLLALIAIISTLSMVSTMVIQEASAAPKEQKTTSHIRESCDPDTGHCYGKYGHNTNGPDGHENCKSSFTYDPDIGEYQEESSRCISN